jgi:alginate O-acetyltransferase complex protein AlgI
LLFNSALYALFLAVVYVVFWWLRRQHLTRTIFLTLASYFFYFYGTFDTAKDQDVPFGPLGWAVLCLGIIFVGSSLDYFIGRKLGATENPKARKALLLVSVVYYLGVLALFKYFNFAADSVVQICGWLGLSVKPVHLRLVLPFGISFFTFETMSYTIDVYRKELPPSKSYLEYLLFVAFFPHLVAGPIVRPRSILPQLAVEPVHDDNKKAQGLYLIARGLMKKMIIGDTLAVNLVGRVFDNPERYSSLECLVAVYAYAIQIYADFSGYTDVARGSAQLFGYDLPLNFDAPYTARNLQDFWRRWHISLSTWLRDYLYVPLGGNKSGPWGTYRNLMITMILGGLWHGASWNFVLWGTLHGAGLAVNRVWQRHRGDRPVTAFGTVIGVFACFHFVCFCWVFFRAPSFAHATLLLGRMGKLTITAPNLSLRVMAVLALGMLTHFTPKRAEQKLQQLFALAPAPAQGIILAACAYALHFAASAKTEPFVYGQF